MGRHPPAGAWPRTAITSRRGGGRYKVGDPYQVGGRWYNPREQPDYDRVGIASWYGSDFHGRHTANGEVFDMNALTAAHPTLPLPSYAYVTNLSNNRTILVRVNDRGPYVGDRVIDLSKLRRCVAACGRPRHGTRSRALCRPRARSTATTTTSASFWPAGLGMAGAISRPWSATGLDARIGGLPRRPPGAAHAVLCDSPAADARPGRRSPLWRRHGREPERTYADAGLWSPADYRAARQR